MSSLRSDAQRNLERVLSAAADAFAERGPDVTVDEIARQAGVGHATVFRRFPTKESLLAAVVQERVQELDRLAERALEAEDPGRGFEELVWAVAELHTRQPGLHDCLIRCDSSAGAELEGTIQRIVERAQSAGAIRRDLAPAAVPALVRAALRAAPGGEWRPLVQVVLDGLRPPLAADGAREAVRPRT